MRRVVAALLCLMSAILVMVGSFLPLMTGELSRRGSTQIELAITSWGIDSDAPTMEGGVPANGVPVVFAAAFLLAAAVIGLLAVSGMLGANSGAGGLAAAVGAAFLAGTVWTLGVQAQSWVDTFRPMGATRGGGDFRLASRIDIGFWMLVMATVLSILAAVLASRRGRTVQPVPALPPMYLPAMSPVDPGAPGYGLPGVSDPVRQSPPTWTQEHPPTPGTG